ncbi:MAG: flagellar protein FlaG [Treponema sp.]|jgi:uncharacterized FlaG/YvyC family protein|nr:flagellar protein FlaG [Treponema sp.]
MAITGIGSAAGYGSSRVPAGREVPVIERPPFSQADRQPVRSVELDFSDFERTFNRKLQFVVNPQSNEVIVNVIEVTTDRVIRVIPSEEMQLLSGNLKKVVGFLYSRKI